jgi:hypothetical protein
VRQHLGSLDKVTRIVRLGIAVATGHFWRCPRSPESRRRRFGVAARRLRKRQEPLPLGVWRRKSPARHPGRTGSDLGSAALIRPATRNSSEG